MPNSKECLNPRDAIMQIVPTLGPKIYSCYLHWAIWMIRGTISGPRYTFSLWDGGVLMIRGEDETLRN